MIMLWFLVKKKVILHSYNQSTYVLFYFKLYVITSWGYIFVDPIIFVIALQENWWSMRSPKIEMLRRMQLQILKKMSRTCWFKTYWLCDIIVYELMSCDLKSMNNTHVYQHEILKALKKALPQKLDDWGSKTFYGRAWRSYLLQHRGSVAIVHCAQLKNTLLLVSCIGIFPEEEGWTI